MLSLLHNPSISIFSATVHGAAEFVAEDISLTLAAASFQTTVFPRAKASDIINCRNLAIFCVSTTGEGELPRRMLAVYEELQKTRPPLKDLDYLVIVLGDSTYGEEMFCRGGKRLDELLLSLGANQLTPPLLIDADVTNNPEEVAIPWIESML